MVVNTCVSVIAFQDATDFYKDPLWSDREALAVTMFNQGKTASNPNWLDSGPVGERAWADHAAAQEFIDYVVANAPASGVTIVSTSIEDLP
jgi:hypothetical protein